jgi:hypothetical protein
MYLTRKPGGQAQRIIVPAQKVDALRLSTLSQRTNLPCRVRAAKNRRPAIGVIAILKNCCAPTDN